MNKTEPDQFWEALGRFAQRYCSDAEVRARVARGDTSDLDRSALNIPDGMDIRIVEQTADTFYFPLPPVPNQALSDESLGSMAGGSCLPGHHDHHDHHPQGCLFQPTPDSPLTY